MWRSRYFWCIFIAACGTGSAIAHPILDDNHHRTITLHLSARPSTREVHFRVDYQLEMDERVAQLEAFRLFKDRLDILRSRTGLFLEWGKRLGPRLAENLLLQIDSAPVHLTFQSMQLRFLADSSTGLEHPRLDFIFDGGVHIGAETWHDLKLHEGNYSKDNGWPADRGQLKLDITAGPSIETADRKKFKVVPGSSLESLPDEQYEQLKDISARFSLTGAEDDGVPPASDSTAATPSKGQRTLVSLLTESQQGFVVLCILAFGLGAVHALQPGHGKTLVAAYLVGERGTVGHACLLGLTTTLTHTGAVLVLAVILAVAPLPFSHRQLETTLGMIMGLLIAALGAWLLLRRLSGRADHFHFGGQGHDHAHGPHDHLHHHHHDHVHASHTPAAGWVGLILLGVQGGLVPCWDAVVMLLFAIGANLMRQALPLLLCFSAGLALVLVVLGITVVQAKGIVGVRWGETRFFRALPYLSAVAITLIGLGLCYQSVHR